MIDYTTVISAINTTTVDCSFFAVLGHNLVSASDSPFPTHEVQYLVLTDSDDVRKTAVAIQYSAGYSQIATRGIFEGNWIDDDWLYFSTTTPPQEFDLPLASGFSNGGGGNSVYWKDQFNQVHFLVSVANQNSLSSGDVIATLPAGFRPSNTVIFVLGSSSGAVRKTGSLNVTSDGSIIYFGDPLSSGAVSFGAGAFVAAN